MSIHLRLLDLLNCDWRWLLLVPNRSLPSCSKIRQNFRFSSAAAVATIWPSGLNAEWRILES